MFRRYRLLLILRSYTAHSTFVEWKKLIITVYPHTQHIMTVATPIGSSAPTSSVQKKTAPVGSKAAPKSAWGNSASKASTARWGSSSKPVSNAPRRVKNTNPIGTKRQTQTNVSRTEGNRGGRQYASAARSVPARRVPAAAAASKSSETGRPPAWGAAASSQANKAHSTSKVDPT